MTDFTLSSIYYWLHDGQTSQPEASPQRPVCGWRGSYQDSWAERSHCVSTHESFLEPAENKLSNGQTHQMQSSRTWMTLYMASSLTMSCSNRKHSTPNKKKRVQVTSSISYFINTELPFEAASVAVVKRHLHWILYVAHFMPPHLILDVQTHHCIHAKIEAEQRKEIQIIGEERFHLHCTKGHFFNNIISDEDEQWSQKVQGHLRH